MARNRTALDPDNGLTLRHARAPHPGQDVREAIDTSPREDDLWHGTDPTSGWGTERDGSTPALLHRATSDDAARAALTAAAAARVAAAAAVKLSDVVRKETLAATREARKDPHWLGTFAAFLATLGLLIVVASAHSFVTNLSLQIEHETLVSMAKLAPLEVCAGGQREAMGSACRSLFAVCANTTQADALLKPLAEGKNFQPLSTIASYASENWDLTSVETVQTLVAGLLECRAFQSSYLALHLESFIAGERKELWDPVGYANTTPTVVDKLFQAVEMQLAVGQVESQLYVEEADSGLLNIMRIAVSNGEVSRNQLHVLGGLPKEGFVWRVLGKGGMSAVWATVRQNPKTAACLARSRMTLLANITREQAPGPSTDDLGGVRIASTNSSGSLASCAARGAAIYLIPASCHSYVCRNGVDVRFWGNWANFLAITKQSFPTQFLGMKGTYDDMYAIYTGSIGALLGAAAVFVASLLLSLVKTLAPLFLKLPLMWGQWRKGKAGGKELESTEPQKDTVVPAEDLKS